RTRRAAQGVLARNNACSEEACRFVRCRGAELDRRRSRRRDDTSDARSPLHPGQGRPVRDVCGRNASRHCPAHRNTAPGGQIPQVSASCTNVLVVAETADGCASELSYELLGLARQLVRADNGLVFAAALEKSDAPCIQELGARGADQVLSIADGLETAYTAERWLAILPLLLAELGPAHIVLGHTALGAELGPRLAFRLGCAVATGCERLELNDGKLSILRP